ncbi:MAG: peptidoglycan DD-metalloendopeptidase family protein [Chloroflexi bacterium]|nr:peptidoglycan DD-metalloendopeptidase family protein [Chloroflexota bacterium]
MNESESTIPVEPRAELTADHIMEPEAGFEDTGLSLADWLTLLGLREQVQAIGGHILVFGVVLLVLFVIRFTHGSLGPTAPQGGPALASTAAAPQPQTAVSVELPPFPPREVPIQGIKRQLKLTTVMPSRPRMEIVEYTVQQGDTLASIAEKFGLKAESIFWSNLDVLKGDAHSLKVGMVLRIPPADGVLYEWKDGDTVENVAEKLGVEPDAILNHPVNEFDPVAVALGEIEIPVGKIVFVPGGKYSKQIDWSRPIFLRDAPAASFLNGPGACGTVYNGPIGTYTFIWPTTSKWITTYYNPAYHPAIDIAGSIGLPVYAVDNGVVVYSGWSNNGYGYVVVIDHGNGWQSLYAHLSQIYVGCAQEVFQGTMIGAMGSTGNSTGPHVHLELIHRQYGKVDPLQFLAPP